MKGLLPFFLLGFFLLLMIVVGIVAYRRELRRTEQFRIVAEELGFDFFPTHDSVLMGWLESFHLCSQGRNKIIRNGMRGKTRELEVAIFEYKYTVGSGKNARTYNTSVVCFRSDILEMPEFCLRPESFWHRIGSSIFGMRDIDFDSHPVFSKSYLLKGPDEEAIREVFTPDVLDYFESTSGLSVEANGSQLLFYRFSSRVEPDQVRKFLEEGFEVLGLFRHAGNQTT